MSIMSEATADVCEAMRFEYWLRFYFVMDNQDSGKLFLIIPQEHSKGIKDKWKRFDSLIEMLDGYELTYESSKAAVCKYITITLDGKKYEDGTGMKVFNDPEFKIEMYLFNLWCQSHEAKLDEKLFDFSEWETMYAEWRRSDQVKDYLKNLRKQEDTDESEGTTH